MSLSDEYVDFYEKHETIILISFGAMFVPPEYEINLLLEAVKLVSK